ncbi:hypothetical protein FUAX_08750 [Fulvitalea axinellae]|uniref:DUF4105 domain-containing protein n=1 Tax=Fulvitalea axinellae TaxID=1182444 RepID=A0AAU9CEZ3_9BACT|nr:hypothetical protein FUAX_08750 [Fulvitalea axinellae]
MDSNHFHKPSRIFKGTLLSMLMLLLTTGSFAQDVMYLNKNHKMSVTLSFYKETNNFHGLFTFLTDEDISRALERSDAIVVFGDDEQSTFVFNISRVLYYSKLEGEGKYYAIIKSKNLTRRFISSMVGFRAQDFSFFRQRHPLLTFDTDLYYNTHEEFNDKYIGKFAADSTNRTANFHLLLPEEKSDLDIVATNINNDRIGTFSGYLNETMWILLNLPGEAYTLAEPEDSKRNRKKTKNKKKDKPKPKKKPKKKKKPEKKAPFGNISTKTVKN